LIEYSADISSFCMMYSAMVCFVAVSLPLCAAHKKIGEHRSILCPELERFSVLEGGLKKRAILRIIISFRIADEQGPGAPISVDLPAVRHALRMRMICW